MTVYDLKKILDTLIGCYKNANNFLITAKLPGKKEYTSIIEFDVEDEKLYLSSDNEDEEMLSVARLRKYIIEEAKEKCWEDDESFTSKFYDCEIKIYDYDEDDTYCLSEVIIYKNQLVLICSDNNKKNEEEYEEEEEEEEITLTLSEAKLIAGALNYVGDKAADANGYSAGEKYWDLCTKFQKIFNFILEY